MEKSETIDVQSVTRDKALKSPVYKIVHDTWRYFDEKISEPVNLKEEDIVRLIIWSLENIKGGETDPTESSRDLRRSIVKLLREAAFPSAVVESLSSIVCAYAIVCLDCAFMFCCRNDIYRLCNIAKQSIKKEYKQYVSECKDQIKKAILQSRQNSDLGEWCTEHLLNAEFLTDEDGAWIVENGPVIEASANDSLDSNTFEMTEEDWVLRYNPKITSKYKENKYLIDKIKKLRESYLNAIHQPERFNRTGFLRDNIFWPKTPWLHNPNEFPAEAIRDIFNDTQFTDGIVSKAKKKN